MSPKPPPSAYLALLGEAKTSIDGNVLTGADLFQQLLNYPNDLPPRVMNMIVKLLDVVGYITTRAHTGRGNLELLNEGRRETALIEAKKILPKLIEEFEKLAVE